jgi:hypothetical protein
VQVISTSFQTSKLFVAFNYGNFDPTAVAISQMTGQYGEAFEINQGSNEFVFTLPYLSKFHQLFVPNTNNPTELDSMGLVRFVVLNSLVAPNNTPTIIHFNVFIAGADDFALSALSASNNLSPRITPPPTILRREQESDLLPLILFTESATAPLLSNEANTYKQDSGQVLAPNSVVKMRTDIGEQHVDNVRHLLRKYQFVQRFAQFTPAIVPPGGTTPPPQYTVISLMDLISVQQPPVDPIEAIAEGVAPSTNGLFGHFGALYRMYNGALRLKIMLEDTSAAASFSVFYFPPFQADGTYIADFVGFDEYVNSQLAPQSDTDQLYPPSVFGSVSIYQYTRLPISFVNGLQKTAEFEIPYNSNYQSLLTRNSIGEPYLTNSPISSLGYIVLVPHPTSTQSQTFVDIFVSLADESRFGTLYRVPTVVPTFHFTSAINYNTVWPDDYNVPTSPTYTLQAL